MDQQTSPGGLSWRLIDGPVNKDVTEKISGQSITWALVGGCSHGEAKIELPPATFPTIGNEQARLIAYSPLGDAIWEGIVTDPGITLDDDAEYLALGVTGSMMLASLRAMPLVYLDATLDGWEPMPGLTDAQRADKDDDALVLGFPSGYPVGPGKVAGFDWVRLTHSEQSVGAVSMTVQSGVTTGWVVDVIALDGGVASTVASWAASTAATPRTVTLPAGADTVRVQMRRTGAATNVTTDTVWTKLSDVRVIGSRVDRYGNAATDPAADLTSADVVEDLIGRGMLGPVDAAGAVVEDSTAVLKALSWPEGVRGSAVLDALREQDPAMTWQYGVRRERGYEFGWTRLSTSARYDVLDVDAVTWQGDDVQPCQRVRVVYTDAEQVLRSVVVTLATEPGDLVRDADPITMDGTHTEAEAIAEGEAALAELANPEHAATIGVDRLVKDRWLGVDVEPFETRPGSCRMPSGDVVVLNEVTWDSDGAQWAVGSEVLSTEDKIKAIERGDIKPGAPLITLPPLRPSPPPPLGQPTNDPSEPPPTSPTPTILAGPATAIVTWTRDADARTRYNLYVAATDSAPLDATTLVVEGVTGPAAWVARFADGTLIPADVDSYFALVATNVAGDAAASPWTAGRAGVIDPEFVTLTVGTLLANDTFTQALTVAGASIGGGTWDAEKFELPESLVVDLITHLATFYGDVIARTLTAEHLKVQGAYNILEGIMTLANGINPPAAPRLSVGLPPSVQLRTASGDWSAVNEYGLGWTGSGWVTTHAEPYFTVVNLWDSTGMQAAGGSDQLTGFQPKGGVVKLGSSYFVLGQDATRGSAWYAYRFDASWVKTGESLVNSLDLPYALGSDGTNLVLVVRDGSGNHQVSRRDTSFAVVGGIVSLGANAGAPLGVVWDTGRSRILVATATEIRAHDSSTGARVTADDVPRPSGNQVRGLGWDGTRLHVLDSTGKIHALAQRNTSAAITATVTAVNSAGTVETTPSPVASITLKAGQYLRAEANPLNDDGDPLKPKRIQFYVSAPTTRLAQGVLTAGTLTQTWDTIATGGAVEPTVNGFDSLNITPGALRSDAADLAGPVIDLPGSGDGRTGPHRWTLAEAAWVDDTDWITPTLAGTWVNFGASPTYAPAGYRRLGRVVYLRGLVKSGSGLILTLPAGYRPDVVSMFPAVTGGPNTGAASTGTAHTHAMPNTGRIDVEQDGSVRLLYGVNTYVSLAGICFPVDQ